MSEIALMEVTVSANGGTNTYPLSVTKQLQVKQYLPMAIHQ